MPHLKSVPFTFLFFVVAIVYCGVTQTAGQKAEFTPDMSVSGVKLGDRVSGKAFLGEYQTRTGESGKPEYLFYNSHGTTVMKMVAASAEDPYFITEIEVVMVGNDYQKRHFYLEKIGYFMTESGIFIGFRQSGGSIAIAVITGVPNLSRSNMIGPKDVVKKIGAPTTQIKNDDKDTLDYVLDSVAVGDSQTKYGYAAQYYFNKSKLRRFSMKLVAK